MTIMVNSATRRGRGMLRRVAALVAFALVSSCGGGGGGGGGTTPPPPPPPPPPAQFGTLAITQNNAEIIGFSVALAESTLSVAQTAANEVVIFSSPAGVMSRQCQFDGSATITHVDSDTSFTVSAGDSLTIDYFECYGDAVDGEMSGSIEIAITAYVVDSSSANLVATVTIANPLRIVDRVDPALFADVTATFDIEFSLDPTETLVVRTVGAGEVTIDFDGTTETLSDLVVSRIASTSVPGPNIGEVDIDLTFDFLYDSGFFGGTATCETNTVFSLLAGSISSANVLCRGLNASAVRTSGFDEVSIDPEGDGTFTALGTIEWGSVFDGFLREPSGLNLTVLFAGITTQKVSLASRDIVYDPGRDRLLIATSASDTFAANALVSLSPSQNSQIVLENFGFEPSAVAVSADGAFIYVGFTDRDEVRRYDADTMQLLATVQIQSSDPASNQYGVLDIAVSPVASDTLAVSFNYVGTAVDDVTVFSAAVQLPNRARNAPAGGSSTGERLIFSDDGSRIHTFYQPLNARTVDLVVDANGVVAAFDNSRVGFDVASADGKLYSAGAEFDADTLVKLGTFGFPGRYVAVDPVNRRLYRESFDTFDVWDLDRRLPIATYELGFEFDAVRRLAVAGDFIVFVTDNDLRLLDRNLVEAQPAGECLASQGQTQGGNAYTQYSCDVIDAIYDPFADRIYAAVTSDVPGNGNSIAVINHNTGAVENYVPVPSNPKRLALSADGTRLYALFADAELLVAIDTASQTVASTWQMGTVTPQNGYNVLDPEKILQIAASPVEANTVVVLTAEESNSIDKTFVAFRDGARLPDEVPISELNSNSSNPYPQPVFDDSGALYALHSDNTDPYFESIVLTQAGLAATDAWFSAPNALWFPREISVKGTDVYLASGDVVNVVNQTVERRFDYSMLPFPENNPAQIAYADPGSDDVWLLMLSSFDSTGLARFDDTDGSLLGTEQFPLRPYGRNADYSHRSVFSVGADKLGMIIDEREGVLVIDKSAVQ